MIIGVIVTVDILDAAQKVFDINGMAFMLIVFLNILAFLNHLSIDGHQVKY